MCMQHGVVEALQLDMANLNIGWHAYEMRSSEAGRPRK